MTTCTFSVVRLGDAEAVLHQIAAEQLADALVVIDDEDVLGIVRKRFDAPSRLGYRLCRCRHRYASHSLAMDCISIQPLWLAWSPRASRSRTRPRSSSAIMAKRKRRA